MRPSVYYVLHRDGSTMLWAGRAGALWWAGVAGRHAVALVRCWLKEEGR